MAIFRAIIGLLWPTVFLANGVIFNTVYGVILSRCEDCVSLGGDFGP